MSVSVCPVTIVQASVEQVWGLLSEPTHYALWWDAQTRAIVPDGPAQPGQRIYAQTRALGRAWGVNILVGQVDEARRQLQLTTRLPLGITVYNHITCAAVDGASCRVSFG